MGDVAVNATALRQMHMNEMRQEYAPRTDAKDTKKSSFWAGCCAVFVFVICACLLVGGGYWVISASMAAQRPPLVMCEPGLYDTGETDNRCVECPPMTWSKRGADECTPCASECDTCDATTGDCLTCDIGYVLDEGVCVAAPA